MKTEAVIEYCAEEQPDGSRCNDEAEFLLWGKLLPPEALGPRCWVHAVRHTDRSMPERVSQWAAMDLRGLVRKVPCRA